MALAEPPLNDDTARPSAEAPPQVVLGEDWVAPHHSVEKELRDSRAQRGFLALNRSPLTRKIIIFNLIALNVLVVGILWLNASRDTLGLQKTNALQAEVELVADVFEALVPAEASTLTPTTDGDAAERPAHRVWGR